MPLTVLAHPRTEVLEDALLAALRRIRGDDPLATVWIVAPTRRLGRRLQRRIAAESGGAALGLNFLDLRGLARALGALSGVAEAPPLGPVTNRVLAEEALRRIGEESLLVFRGAVASLQPAFRRASRGGVQADAALACCEDAGNPAPLVLPAYSAWRERVEDSPLEDTIDFPERVATALEGGAPPLRPSSCSASANSSAAGVAWWSRSPRAPRCSCSQTRAQARARRDSTRPKRSSPTSSRASGSAPPQRLEGENAEPARLGRYASFRGARCELEEALRTCWAWHEGGLPLEDMAVVARGLEPYAPHLRLRAQATGLPRRRRHAGEPAAAAPAGRPGA